ncbi:hypothetical protein GQ44DRAFT_831578 [Phaeosphaeriaceae sp. PMI808]|nr:hypothetical protein GQ44DRAFT_831578 [Phaeosphaeriaceae sp. PMI808]
MSSQDTIEDPTLYQDKFPTNDSEKSVGAASIREGSLNCIQSAHVSQPAPERKDSQDKGDKERTEGPPHNIADPSPPSQLERVRLSVIQLGCDFTQLKERMGDTMSSISYVMTRLEELDDLLDNLRNEVDQPKGTTQRSRKERGILKRGREERDDRYQLVGYTRREKKRARVIWEG